MPEIDLDETDFRLLQWLDREGEVDVDEAAEEFDISTSTVYYRLDKYRQQGILKGNVADLDPAKLGLELAAITTIETSYERSHDEIAEELAELSGVQRVYSMLGEMSFYVFSHVSDHSHLQRISESIIEIDGVENSVTNVVLRTYKDDPRLLSNYDEDDLEQLFNEE
ncbi:Lrp/AsnC family transcriptional regulator [Halospeciosus flavus]|uniref:Lrp/AsnC family transcriptional regulator n=1 Tax=Halospeciosus flavus TaxID=3032283 RepID=A0ABD5Z3Q3_9EURY|nr:Lrp/AsnC family transcriptional regulator [Halospeciosus flavus]